MSDAPQITIRRAEPKDAPEIIRLIDALNTFVKDPPTDLTPDDIRRDGFSPNAWFVCFLAERDDEAVGYALVHPAFSIERGGRGLHLADLYVEDDLRGQGVGRALMARVARHGKDLGALWLAWDVWTKNDSAKAFYERLGAKINDEVVEMLLEGEELEALAKGQD